MDDAIISSFNEFKKELPDILEIYSHHEQTFDSWSIHGRMHICRTLIFGEFMLRYYYANTQLKPRWEDVRYAIAFHDSGRQGNGIDIWEKDSANICTQYLSSEHSFNEQRSKKVGEMIEKDGSIGWILEKRIVHDADVLEIMRPVC